MNGGKADSFGRDSNFRFLVAPTRQQKRTSTVSIYEPWSNGQAEGQITKLKMIKRRM